MNSIKFLFFFIPILSVILITINLLLAPHAPYKEKKTPFECGYHSFLLQNRSQFSISFFAFGLLFLLFDLEIVLIYPMGLSIEDMEIHSILLAFIFIAILTVGFVFELGKGALKIESKQNAPAPYTDLQMLKSKSYNNIFSTINNNDYLYSFAAQELKKDKVLTPNHLPCDELADVDSYNSALSKTHVFDIYKNLQLKFDRMSYDINSNVFNKYTTTSTYDRESVFLSLNKINTQMGELATMISTLSNYIPLILPLLLSIATILIKCFISSVDLFKEKIKFMRIKLNKFACLLTILFILMLFTVLVHYKSNGFNYHIMNISVDLFKILDIFTCPCYLFCDISILTFGDNIASSSGIKRTYNQVSEAGTSGISGTSRSIATNIGSGSGSGSGEDPDDNKRPRRIHSHHYIEATDTDAINTYRKRLISAMPDVQPVLRSFPKSILTSEWLRNEISRYGLVSIGIEDVMKTNSRLFELVKQEPVNLSEVWDLLERFFHLLAISIHGTFNEDDTYPADMVNLVTISQNIRKLQRLVYEGGIPENYHIIREQIRSVEGLLMNVEWFLSNAHKAIYSTLSKDDIELLKQNPDIRLIRELVAEGHRFIIHLRDGLDGLESLQVEIQKKLSSNNIPPYCPKKP